ncbi:MAG: BrnA antitoxin family protein [Alphaproteobacteria bacterium]|nr:BrnA antitoxin family protein [Alphaproteobacteria bacterium]MBV9586458.1 BrnA antitoxin family protein [Alphaproteobacteria bacterium]MBV9964357.1 BrnA antitoxin family protein [Alphaproteobacteria bacterium]
MSGSKERITRVTLEEAKRLKDETDYARLDAMSDEDIAKAVAEDPDAVPLDVDWSKAKLVMPPGKENVTLRIDRDVLAWFRATGKGFHTRMNAVLRAYMEAHKQQPR